MSTYIVQKTKKSKYVVEIKFIKKSQQFWKLIIIMFEIW